MKIINKVRRFTAILHEFRFSRLLGLFITERKPSDLALWNPDRGSGPEVRGCRGKITGTHFLNMSVGSSIARTFPQKEVRVKAKIHLLLPGAAATMLVVLLGCTQSKVEKVGNYTKSVAQTKEGQIEYTLRGQGPVVLKLTGSMEDCESSGGNAALLGAGFSILTPSRPGYGKTPLSVGRTAPEAADAMVALIDTLGISNVDVIAESAGGPTALYLAARHPERVRKLILKEAVSKYAKDLNPKNYETVRKFYTSQYWYTCPMLKMMARVAPRKLARVTMSIFGAHDPDEAIKGMSKADIKGLCDFYLRWRGSWNKAANNDLEQTTEDSVLDSIKAPTLIVHSREDGSVPFTSAEYSHAHIVASELWEAPTWNHMTLGHGAYKVDSKVVEFLKK
jgi:pimeloyl-ACP methyl ester carboxylesterase